MIFYFLFCIASLSVDVSCSVNSNILSVISHERCSGLREVVWGHHAAEGSQDSHSSLRHRSSLGPHLSPSLWSNSRSSKGHALELSHSEEVSFSSLIHWQEEPKLLIPSGNSVLPSVSASGERPTFSVFTEPWNQWSPREISQEGESQQYTIFSIHRTFSVFLQVCWNVPLGECCHSKNIHSPSGQSSCNRLQGNTRKGSEYIK